MEAYKAAYKGFVTPMDDFQYWLEVITPICTELISITYTYI